MNSHDGFAAEPFERLSRMPEFSVARHEPDPRGCAVVNGRGRKIGEVRDLIVDTSRMTACYLDIELDGKLFDWRGEDRHVLLPVEHAHIDGRHIVVPEITEAWVTDLRVQRLTHDRQFWDHWWSRAEPQPGVGLTTRVTRAVDADELRRAIDDVQPGETVRIPVVNEDIVVQRRPATAPLEAEVRHE